MGKWVAGFVAVVGMLVSLAAQADIVGPIVDPIFADGFEEPELISIELTPSPAVIAVGETLQFTATGIFDNSSSQDLTASATWDSDNSAVLIFFDNGLAVGISPGTAWISAAVGDVMGGTRVDVE